MQLYRLNWHKRQSGKDVLLHQDHLEAQDAEAAKRKARALFADGGAIVGADRIKLYEPDAQEPFWEHP
jgi:hypothetical protein